MQKALCTSTCILDFADFTKPFKLHMDASTTGLGAGLYQKQDGNNWVRGYASQALSKSESHYQAHKLEFLALKWAVTKSFQEYLMEIPLPCTPTTILWPMSWPQTSWMPPNISGLPSLPSSISPFTSTWKNLMLMHMLGLQFHGIRTLKQMLLGSSSGLQ